MLSNKMQELFGSNAMNKLYDFDQDAEASERVDRRRLERHEFIKSRLRLAGTSLAEIGRELGVKNGTMSTVSRGLGNSKRVQLRLSEVLQLEPSVLWPERFPKLNEGEQS